MKVKPLNRKKYMVWGHQLEDISLVIDALSLACMLGTEDYPPETCYSKLRNIDTSSDTRGASSRAHMRSVVT